MHRTSAERMQHRIGAAGNGTIAEPALFLFTILTVKITGLFTMRKKGVAITELMPGFSALNGNTLKVTQDRFG